MATAKADGHEPAEISDSSHIADTSISYQPAPGSPSNREAPRETPTHNEDPATVAASEELRHTSISDKEQQDSKGTKASAEPDEEPSNTLGTPEPTLSDTQDEEMRERLSSPKKKRGRDQDDDGRELLEETSGTKNPLLDGDNVNGSKQTRLEPHKKRARDGSEDRTSETAEVETAEASSSQDLGDAKGKPSDDAKSSTAPASVNQTSNKPQTSSSAFAKSGFASLAGSSTSPFGAVGAAKPSVFGGSTSSNVSGFGALAVSKSPTLGSSTTTSGFGALGASKPSSGFGFGGGTTSGFGALGGKSAFGSALGNGFAGGSAPKLSSFAAPGSSSTIGSSKPTKAFGAPESDAEGSGDEEESDGDGPIGSGDEERTSASPEERKKSKSQRVQVEDGEAGEATLLHIRAKLFSLASKEAGWKERGVGVLKINAPYATVSFDEEGHAIPGSYDPSTLEDSDEKSDGTKVPRLIMRQENTHRVILNTALLKHMVFKDKPAASSAQIYFTAIEGDTDPKPVNMLLKMNESNAELFRREVASIQRE